MIDAPITETESAPPSLDQARRAFDRDYLVRILRMTRGNVTNAARIAGRNRTEFYRLLDRHSLSPGMFKPSSLKPSPRGDTPVAGTTTEPASSV
jgi:two-component system response regulator GlrR